MSRGLIVLGAVITVVVAGQFGLAPATADERCPRPWQHWPNCTGPVTPLDSKVMKLLNEKGGNWETTLSTVSREVKSSNSLTRKTLKSLEGKGMVTVDPEVYGKKQGMIRRGPLYHD